MHHPRYTWDKKGMVFANGRGVGARVWCIPDLTSPGSMYQVTLPPENVCADEPTIGKHSGRLDEFYKKRDRERIQRYQDSQRRWLSAA